MFPDWTSEDIVFALQETGGDLEGTVERMSEGIFSCDAKSILGNQFQY